MVYASLVLQHVAQSPALNLHSRVAVVAAMMPPVPPWVAGNTPEPVSLDVGNQVDVTPYVRFETGHDDINYGVLDIQVCFMHEGRNTNVYLLHYFALAEDYDKNGTLVHGWDENFVFPPALSKMVARYQGRTIYVFVQYCLAVNNKGISVYGSNKGYRRRLIHHVLYHERLLLGIFEARVTSLSRERVGHPPVTWSSTGRSVPATSKTLGAEGSSPGNI